MSTEIIFTIISIATTSFVGIILSNQIKSQKQLISQYEGYLKAVNPNNILILHNREVEKLKSLSDQDIKQLRSQIIELGNYVDYQLDRYEEMAASINQPELFNRTAVINRNMPQCARVLKVIHESNHPNIPNP